jgi:protoporphyrinogen/coproporphyrinogen III oxidase
MTERATPVTPVSQVPVAAVTEHRPVSVETRAGLPHCDVLIIGAGIAGLTAAVALAEARPDLSVLVVDAADRAGGQIRTTLEDGYTFEHGAGALPVSRPETLELIARAGLEERLEPVDPGGTAKYVYCRGGLHPVPRTPGALVGSSLLSWRGKLRLLAEPLAGWRSRPGEDESVYDFAARRFGHEAARLGAMIALQGVTAGDARVTSLEAIWPRVHALDRGVGRLGLMGHAVRARAPGNRVHPCTFRCGGLQVLTDTLGASLGERLRCRTAVRQLRPSAGNRFAAMLGDGAAIEARQIIVALPPSAAATVLRPLVPLEMPAGVPMRVIGLGYPSTAFPEPPPGLGFLTSPGEANGVIGAIVSSNLFPDQAPADRVLIRVFLGGAFAPWIAGEPRDAVVARVERLLRRLYGLRGETELVRDTPWPGGIVQYPRGHMARVRRLELGLRAHPGLQVARSAIAGVGLEHAIEAGAAAASNVINRATVGAIV